MPAYVNHPRSVTCKGKIKEGRLHLVKIVDNYRREGEDFKEAMARYSIEYASRAAAHLRKYHKNENAIKKHDFHMRQVFPEKQIKEHIGALSILERIVHGEDTAESEFLSNTHYIVEQKKDLIYSRPHDREFQKWSLGIGLISLAGATASYQLIDHIENDLANGVIRAVLILTSFTSYCGLGMGILPSAISYLTRKKNLLLKEADYIEDLAEKAKAKIT
jgi:hypothetical protein